MKAFMVRYVRPACWLALLGGAVALAGCASYQRPYGYGQPYGAQAVAQPPQQNVKFVTAEVLSATPVYQQVQVARPRQECQQVPVESGGGREVAGTLIGGALGGLVGNQFGRGGGNAAMTALGAVAGAVAGNQVGTATAPPPGSTTTQCRTVTDYVMQNQPNGYDVTYRYNGQVYHTHSDTDPGSTIRVRVAVSPASGS